MEKINEKYYLDSDAHNFVLLKKKIKENMGLYGEQAMIGMLAAGFC